MDIDEILKKATKEIRGNYFQLPIDGQGAPIYRERVYCYELYHQLRLAWPENSPYELSGEIDKSGHPLIRGNHLDNVKPDLLVHVPGSMDNNYAAIEVKPIIAKKSGIKKDLETLTAFLRHANYQKAIYLFYGGGNIQTKIEQIQTLSRQSDTIDTNFIEIWWHSSVGICAQRQ